MLAFEFAERNHTKHPFRNGTAGKKWIANFMLRHPRLTVRKPEPTSVARARGFNRVVAREFFEKLRYLIDKYKFKKSDIYNIDEIGIRTSSTKPPKIISLRGKRQVELISSAERGQLVTVIGCISASGHFLPPGIIFPRKKIPPVIQNGLPPDSQYFASDSG